MQKRHKHPRTDHHENRVYGDPGVGGLLADPLEPPTQREEPNPDAGPRSPDPAPPRHHGDWIVPRGDATRARPGPRLAAIMRRKSRGGMPAALFREDDGTSLDDLKVLARTRRHHRRIKPLGAGRATTPRNAT